MTTRYGFTKMNINEFKTYFQALRIGRLITRVQQHHTYIPSYAHFNGTNHFELQKSLREEHVNRNGWRDIGQHFTIFPDGSIVTGRDLEFSPACIYGNNEGSICIENLGYFDTGHDVMTHTQRDTIIEVTAAICKKLNLPVNTDAIVYHHWFRLDNGRRNNGAGGNKSCPGTDFFGGNKVADCEQNFLPLVNVILTNHNPVTDDSNIQKYVIVTADYLNVRESFSASSKLAADRAPVQMGSILRVYAENDGWLKISNSQNHWASGRYTEEVKRYIVNTTTLNVRSGPGASYPKIGQIYKNEQVFIIQEEGSWAKIAMDNRWVSNRYLDGF
jgi:hypothetical protein